MTTLTVHPVARLASSSPSTGQSSLCEVWGNGHSARVTGCTKKSFPPVVPRLANRRHPEVHRRFTSDEAYVVPGAEHPGDAGARMAAALGDVAAALEEGGTALVVGHGAAIRRGIIAVLGLPGPLHRTVPAPSNCAWHVLEHHPGGRWVLATPRGMAAADVADDAGYLSSAASEPPSSAPASSDLSLK
jgi:hypothetical protein